MSVWLRVYTGRRERERERKREREREREREKEGNTEGSEGYTASRGAKRVDRDRGKRQSDPARIARTGSSVEEVATAIVMKQQYQ